MTAPIDAQVIRGADGKPAFVVLPYEEYRKLNVSRAARGVPHAVVERAFDGATSPLAAWREHLGLTQVEVARRLGITQPAYAQIERSRRPRMSTLARVAAALDLNVDQLRW